METESGIPRSKKRRRFAYDDVSEDHRRAHLRAMGIVAGFSGLIALFFVVQILAVGPCGVGGTAEDRFDRLTLAMLLVVAGPWIMFEFAVVNLARKTRDEGERVVAWSLAGVGVVLAALPFVTQAAAEIWHMCAE